MSVNHLHEGTLERGLFDRGSEISNSNKLRVKAGEKLLLMTVNRVGGNHSRAEGG